MFKPSNLVEYSLFVVFSLLIFSCGGGGGGDSSAPPEAPVTALKTSSIRNFSPGDSWNFSCTATFTDGADTINMSGTVTRQVLGSTVTDPLTSTVCLDLYGTISLSGSGYTLNDSVHEYGTQEANGTIRYYGENLGSGDNWITTPPGYYLDMISPLNFGQSGGTTVTYQDGSTETHAYTVSNSTVIVTTGVGKFEAYRIYIDSTYNYASGTIRRMISHDTTDFVPGLGWVNITGTASYYSAGDVYEYSLTTTETLSSTNVSY